MSACMTSAPGADTRHETSLPTVHPHADIRREHGTFRVDVDLPGVTAADLRVDVQGDVLSLAATVRWERDAGSDSGRTEFGSRRYARLFRLGKDLDPSAITASLRNGVLILRVPPRVEASPRRIPVQVADPASAPAG